MNKKLCELCGQKPKKLYLLRIDKDQWIYTCEECKKAEENLGKATFPKG